MAEVAVAVAALVVGLAVGAAAVLARRGVGAARSAGAAAEAQAAEAQAAEARARLDAQLTAQAAELRRLADAAGFREEGAEALRREVVAFREGLAGLQVREQERRAREDESWRTLSRVASVLAGGQRTGRAGENVLRESLTHFPPAMIETDFRVNGKVVEFGLVLPDGRRLPVDSKWPAERELHELEAAEDPVERERLVREIERAVAQRAREVAQYLDPAVTAPVGVAAVPDGVYAALRRSHAEAYRAGVIVVPYSMAMPVLLFLYATASRLGAAADAAASLADLSRVLVAMEATLENKVARASTMLSNATEELRRQVAKARGTVARAGGEEGEGDADGAPDPEHGLTVVS